MSEINTKNIREQWEILKKEFPQTRIRDAAQQFGISEGELLATTCNGQSVIRLQGDFKEILKSFEALGYVMALTRNEAAVSEIKGHYKNFNIGDKVGVIVGEKIDLRVFPKDWGVAFAVSEAGRNGNLQQSIQFFDIYGDAVHKMFLTERSNPAVFADIVKKFKSSEQTDAIEVQTPPVPNTDLPDSEINIRDFREGWKNLSDTHEFFDFLKNNHVSRTQALRLAGDQLAKKLKPGSFRIFLEAIAEKHIKLMTFIGNHGMIQIYSDYIHNVKFISNWINVMDDGYNMHLREDLIDSAWIVRKRKGDCWISSVELFSADGEVIALFFNKKAETEPESLDWLDLLAKLRA